MKDLKCPMWAKVVEQIRTCHLSTINGSTIDVAVWKETFEELLEAIYAERKLQAVFAPELAFLTDDMGFTYNVMDVLEEYFDVLEGAEEWTTVVDSCEKLLNSFVWKTTSPCQYYFRKGNALMKAGRMKEAEEFGKLWLASYPKDLYAAASNAFLLFAIGKKKEAVALTKKFLGDNFVCADNDDSIYMAATRLLEITKDPWAKERVAKKIAEYEAMR